MLENGKTMVVDEDGCCIFGDFTLKLQGQLVSKTKESHGHWVATCTSLSQGRLETKYEVLSVVTFSTIVNFVSNVCKL